MVRVGYSNGRQKIQPSGSGSGRRSHAIRPGAASAETRQARCRQTAFWDAGEHPLNRRAGSLTYSRAVETSVVSQALNVVSRSQT